MAGKQKRVVVERPTDVGEWGEKGTSGAYEGPLNIAGEQVDVDQLPKFGESDAPKAPASAKAPVRG